MLVALINNQTNVIVQNFTTTPEPLTLPNGNNVHGISSVPLPWTSSDGVYSLVQVQLAAIPNGYQVVPGSTPTLSLANGVVTATYPTQVIPAPVYICQLWQLQAVMTSAQWTAVQSAVASLNNPAVTAFFAHGTNSIPSNSTTLAQLGTAIGLTSAQVTALIQQASAVSIP